MGSILREMKGNFHVAFGASVDNREPVEAREAELSLNSSCVIL